MGFPWTTAVGWGHAILLAALPWLAAWRPWWAPLLAVAVAVVHRTARRDRTGEPWASGLVAVSAAAFVAAFGAWPTALGWLALAAVVAALAALLPRPGGGRPDAADVVALVGWGAAFAAIPALLAVDAGGWLAPAVLLAAARQLGSVAAGAALGARPEPGPPSREIRGTLSLRGVVVTMDGLPVTAPLELDLRAGESLAVLCDDPRAAQALADALSLRSRPQTGEILLDGSPPEPDERLAAVVAPGEAFLDGGLEDNLAALRDEPLDRTTLGAAREACGLDEVAEALAGRSLDGDGEPLTPFHRMLVLAARVLVSPYRVLVAVDPGPWVDVGRADRWRKALVRASVGRTSVWITGDRDLADRADHVRELVGGSL